jgi:transcriptional regulator with XRE-family HTH domain
MLGYKTKMITAAQCRMARAALRLHMRDVAELAGVATNTVARLESGEPVNKATAAAVQRAFEAKGVSFEHNAEGGDVVSVRNRI